MLSTMDSAMDSTMDSTEVTDVWETLPAGRLGLRSLPSALCFDELQKELTRSTTVPLLTLLMERLSLKG